MVKKAKAVKDESYQLTFKGFLWAYLGEKHADDILTRLELFMRRANYNAIILDGTDFVWEHVEKVDENHPDGE